MTKRRSVWLVEDDETSRELVLEALGDRWPVRAFGTVADFERAARDEPDADVGFVLADVCLPDANFMTWLASDRRQGMLDRVPFLVFSSLDDADVVRAAFREGAVDFLSKPFGRAELIVKVERVLGAAPAPRAREPAIEIDAAAMVVRRANGPAVGLTAKEMQILALLLNAPDRSLTRAELNAKAWLGCHVGRKTLDVHLSRLRRKLAPLGLDVRAQAPSRVVLVVPPDAP